MTEEEIYQKKIRWCYSHRCDYIDYSDVMPRRLYREGTGKMNCNRSKILKNVYELIYAPETLLKAQYKAQQGKGERTEIKNFNSDILGKLQLLWEMLANETYVPGKYRTKTIYEPKERLISIAPFFPDRIVHHCIVEVLREHWKHILIDNTYACIEGRDVHKCMEDVHKALVKDPEGTKYCLKLDIRKYYDNVDHEIMKKILRYSISDIRMLGLLDKIVDSNGSNKGRPIGNYTSQYLANLYLSYFDHYVKEVMKLKYYYRYMDDIVVLHESKDTLHAVLDDFGLWLGAELKLEIKHTWQIFPVDVRGIDFVGFVQTHKQILLRKRILLRFYKKWNNRKFPILNEADFSHLYSSEYGWITRCSEVHSNYILTKCIHGHDKQGTFCSRPS